MTNALVQWEFQLRATDWVVSCTQEPADDLMSYEAVTVLGGDGHLDRWCGCLLVPVIYHCDVITILLNVLLLVYKCTGVDVEIRCFTSMI